MKYKPLLHAFLFAIPSVCLMAEDWPAIHADVWALKEDAAKGIKDAMILEERIKIERGSVIYSYRIRIFSEAGKAAAEFSAFPSNVSGLKGRAVYPDGRELPFDSQKDFQRKTAASMGETKADVVKMIPPGLTPNCVVDIRWTSPKNFSALAEEGIGTWMSWRLMNTYFTKKLVVEVPGRFPLSWNLEEAPNLRVVTSEKYGLKTFTWTDLPAEEPAPYCLNPTRIAPVFNLYYMPEVLNYAARQSPGEFWNKYATEGPKTFFEDNITKGSDYKAFVAEMLMGLPETPHAKATELLLRLDGRIRNLGGLSHAEKLAMGTKELEEETHPRDFKKTIRRQSTSPWGMTLLYFHLLKEGGITPVILQVCDRDQRLFKFQYRNHQQFSDLILGIEEAGKGRLILDPGLRFASPGLIPPDFQGTPALEIDSSTWKASASKIPLQPALFNQRRFTYTLDLQEDEDVFTLNSNFTGYPEFVERRRFLPLEASEQSRHLKERIEEVSKSYAVTKAEVLNTTNPKENLAWRVEGRIERPAGRRREVVPFPGMASPIWIPSEFPAVRNESIVLPYARTHLAVSRFKVPKGFSFRKVEPFTHSNGFGRVVWKVDVVEEGGVQDVKVVMRVDLENTVMAAGAYGQLKEFMGWIREADNRTIILEKQ